MTPAEQLRAAAKVLREPQMGTLDRVALLQRFLEAREPLAELLERFAHIEDDFAALGLPPAEIGAPDRHMIAVARILTGGTS